MRTALHRQQTGCRPSLEGRARRSDAHGTLQGMRAAASEPLSSRARPLEAWRARGRPRQPPWLVRASSFRGPCVKGLNPHLGIMRGRAFRPRRMTCRRASDSRMRRGCMLGGALPSRVIFAPCGERGGRSRLVLSCRRRRGPRRSGPWPRGRGCRPALSRDPPACASWTPWSWC